MTILKWIAAAILLLVLGIVFIWGMAALAHGHDIYSNWLMPDARAQDGKRGWGCCNNTDCAPRASKWVNDHWEVEWYRGRWLRVPDQKVETNYPDAWDPKDHQSHACISSSGNIFCFRPGEWLQ